MKTYTKLTGKNYSSKSVELFFDATAEEVEEYALNNNIRVEKIDTGWALRGNQKASEIYWSELNRNYLKKA